MLTKIFSSLCKKNWHSINIFDVILCCTLLFYGLNNLTSQLFITDSTFNRLFIFTQDFKYILLSALIFLSVVSKLILLFNNKKPTL